MQILSHRGLWSDAVSGNSLQALTASLANGFGLETDIRDLDGELVICHDMATSGSPRLADFLRRYSESGHHLTLALNIKADGLQARLQSLLAEYAIQHYFVFDMSIPDTLGYLRRNMITFTRQSEYEPAPAFSDQIAGVWIDAFLTDWFDEPVLNGHLAARRKVCIVSPELHGRSHLELWSRLRQMACAADDRLMLCTDFPLVARSFFSGQN